MPCYDARDDQLREIKQQKLDRLTRVACELANLMPGPDFTDGVWDEVSMDTIAWIKEHRAIDRSRRMMARKKRKV